MFLKTQVKVNNTKCTEKVQTLMRRNMGTIQGGESR